MKLLPVLAFVLILSVSTLLTNGQELFWTGSRSQSLAGASVSLSDCWSVFGNQAGLAGIEKTVIAGSFQNRFLVNELSTQTGLLVIPVQSSAFAFSFLQFGKNPFRQEKFGLSYARSISPQLKFGVQFNYYRIFLPEDNRSAGTTGLELGFQYLLSNRLVLGLHLLNPYTTSIQTLSGSYKYPSAINLGTAYKLSDSFNLMAELENDFSKHLILRTAMEYIILEKLFLRMGISGKPYQLSGGIGFQVKKLSIDLATSYNQYLGNSPSVSFQYQFK
jgi:hypothetical protein